MAVGNEKIITNYVYNGLNSFGMIYSDEIIGVNVTVNTIDSAFTITDNSRIVLDITPNIGDIIKITIEYVYNTADIYMSAEEILALLKTVDGIGSGLDADLLQGINGDQYLKINDDIVVNSIETDTLKLSANTLTSFKFLKQDGSTIFEIKDNGEVIGNVVILNEIKPVLDKIQLTINGTNTLNIVKDGSNVLLVDDTGDTNLRNVLPISNDTYNIGSLTKSFNKLFTNFIESAKDLIFDIPSLKSYIFKNNNIEVARINENGINTDLLNALTDDNIEFGDTIHSLSIIPTVDNTHNLGTSSSKYKTLYIDNIYLTNGDLQTYIDEQDTNVLASAKSYTDNELLNYYDKTEIDNTFLNYYNKTETDNLLTNIDLTAVTTNIVPNNNGVRFLGLDENRWKSLYTNNSIIGTLYKLSDNVDIKLASTILPTADNSYDLGSASFKFNEMYSSYFKGENGQFNALRSNGNSSIAVFNDLKVYTGNSYLVGGDTFTTFHVDANSGYDPILQLNASDTSDDWTMRMDSSDSNILDFRYNNNSYLKLHSNGTAMYPTEDGNTDLGLVGRRWKAVYAVNGTIQTSDRNKKRDIESLNDNLVTAIFEKLRPVQYRMIASESDSGRIHYGFIAQEIEDIHTELGIDVAWLIKTPKTEVIITLDENGNDVETINTIPNEYIYGLRYDEFISLQARYTQLLNNKYNTLEARILALESK